MWGPQCDMCNPWETHALLLRTLQGCVWSFLSIYFISRLWIGLLTTQHPSGFPEHTAVQAGQILGYSATTSGCSQAKIKWHDRSVTYVVMFQEAACRLRNKVIQSNLLIGWHFGHKTCEAPETFRSIIGNSDILFLHTILSPLPVPSEVDPSYQGFLQMGSSTMSLLLLSA
jgi:hypothetical protein